MIIWIHRDNISWSIFPRLFSSEIDLHEIHSSYPYRSVLSLHCCWAEGREIKSHREFRWMNRCSYHRRWAAESARLWTNHRRAPIVLWACTSLPYPFHPNTEHKWFSLRIVLNDPSNPDHGEWRRESTPPWKRAMAFHFLDLFAHHRLWRRPVWHGVRDSRFPPNIVRGQRGTSVDLSVEVCDRHTVYSNQRSVLWPRDREVL